VLFSALLARPGVCKGQSTQNLYYERETITSINGENTQTLVTNTTKVWIKDSMMRIEPATVAGSQKHIMIVRGAETYLLNLNTRTGIKTATGGRTGESPGTQFGLLQYATALKTKGALPLKSELVNGQPTTVYSVPTTPSKGIDPNNTHKVWISQVTQLPVMEVVEEPGAKTTINYKNVNTTDPISGDLFVVPLDIKIVDATPKGGKSPTSLFPVPK